MTSNNKSKKLSIGSALEKAALFYHQYSNPGKLQIQATKPLLTQEDLALAYSPGVAAPCLAIHEDENAAALYTARSNLVAVVSNGTAVLGLGNIGPLASKPVMEGKAVLFKKFAQIDVFDIEINQLSVEKTVETIANLEPSFGGINLEDIKAPECFEIEKQLRERMKIPVFHDDQHGTAIIVAAAVINALHLAGKRAEDVKIVTSGAGAAALACLDLLLKIGVRRENIWVTDMKGVVYAGRPDLMDPWKAAYAQATEQRNLQEIIKEADIFLGLSAAGVLKAEWVKTMAKNPLILALANPIPEIMPEEVLAARPDAMVCTGRSDYPNQVNNVLCFPYIFRGALDVGATAINEEMKIAAVHAIAKLAREAISDVVARAYKEQEPRLFGPQYLIPSPFDPCLILRIAPAVAKAAMETGVAQRPIKDIAAYIASLKRIVFRSGTFMQPIFHAAQGASKKSVVYADGEDPRVLRALELVAQEKLVSRPIIIGRPEIIKNQLKNLGLNLVEGEDFLVKDPDDLTMMRTYQQLYENFKKSAANLPSLNLDEIRQMPAVLAALTVLEAEADAMLCGLSPTFPKEGPLLEQLLGWSTYNQKFSSVSLLITRWGVLFLTDGYINANASAQKLAEMVCLAAEKMKDFDLQPKVLLLSSSGPYPGVENCAKDKMLEVQTLLSSSSLKVEILNARSQDLLSGVFQSVENERMTGQKLAPLLVFPDMNSANIGLQLLRAATEGLHLGPLFLGGNQPAYWLVEDITARGILNMTALAVLAANKKT